MNLLVDDGHISQSTDGSLVIETKSEPIQWLPFGLLAIILVLTVLLWLMTVGGILGNLGFMMLITGIFKLIILTPLVLALGYSELVQWRALRRPTITVSPVTERVDLRWPGAIRRVPFDAITGLHVVEAASTNRLLELESRLYRLLHLERYRVGTLLKHGETVWLCEVTGRDAQARAGVIGQKLLEIMNSTEQAT